jgi:tight adherence protein C
MMNSGALLSMAVFVGVFLLTVALAYVILSRFEGDRRRAVARLRELSPGEKTPERGSMAEIVLSALPKVGQMLLPEEEGLRGWLRTRLNHAGMHGPQAMPIFLACQLLLAAALPLLIVLPPYLFGLIGDRYLVLLGALAMGAGALIPGVWIDLRRNKRQALLRRGLPDALDMLVLCVEGGISLTGAMQRVTAELQVAHPSLAVEMNIAQSEMQLGLTAGEAVHKLSERCGLREVRELAAVLLQSERYGANLVKTLRVHADTYRNERQERAEEMAQKCAVKIIFPTLLCILPATFLVILGPTVARILKMFQSMQS